MCNCVLLHTFLTLVLINIRIFNKHLFTIILLIPSKISSVKGYEEEAMVAYATLLDIEGKTEEAIATLETVNNMSSVWHLAQVGLVLLFLSLLLQKNIYPMCLTEIFLKQCGCFSGRSTSAYPRRPVMVWRKPRTDVLHF